ncbi:carbamoyl phosphate synthase small subunit [Amphibacillus sediminis]|uniref:carbamoyl phosphate synthase small subunit n=1 Tax=Amphibacillus sediminis TaxID=360185 RepID=UPI0008349700|nr:carbamoyl phosphate synthase small subunit [Amphibacillus sediminis]
MNDQNAYLVLNTGDVLKGKWLSKPIEQEGELVFNTAMTGYQEVMTDPSYAGQIVALTYPLIGNYGCNDLVKESIYTALAGLVISTPCNDPEHYHSDYSLVDFVDRANIPALYDIDTRALTKIIRTYGEVYGKISTKPDDYPKQERVNPLVVETVSVNKMEYYQANGTVNHHVVVFDYGHKQSIVDALRSVGCDVTIVPFHTTLDTILELDPDAVVFSNGPGDPASLSDYLPTVKAVAEMYPSLGICLGHQLIALAFGAETTRLPYGHRGSNHPVKDLTTGKVMITSQNHGYVVKDSTINQNDWEISHLNVNDQSVEGLKHKFMPIQTIQFHPEAHPGPVDTHYIFEDFIQSLSIKGEKQHA